MSPPDNHARLHRDFAWSVPEQFNIAQACLHRWARDTPAAVAIMQDAGDEPAVPTTYAALQRDARRLSNALGALGVMRGDRVAIVMPQRSQTAIALMAVFQMGAIAVPLSTLFGAEALQSRLNDSGAKLAIVDEASAGAIAALRESCPALLKVMGAGSANSTMLQLKGEPMLKHDFTPLFKLDHMLKDVRLCLEEARSAGAAFPAAALAGELYAAGSGRGLGDEDFAAVLAVVEGLNDTTV